MPLFTDGEIHARHRVATARDIAAVGARISVVLVTIVASFAGLHGTIAAPTLGLTNHHLLTARHAHDDA